MKTYSFKIPLKITQQIESILNKRFRIAKYVYNAVLRECLKRRNKYFATSEFKLAKQTKDKKQQKELYKIAETVSGYYFISSSQLGRNDSIEQWICQKVRNKSFVSRFLDAKTCSTLAERAKQTVDLMVYGKSGHGKRDFAKTVRFKKEVNCIQDKSSRIKIKNGEIVWFKLHIPLNINKEDFIHRNFINNVTDKKIRQVSLVRKRVRNNFHWYAHFTVDSNYINKPNLVCGFGDIGLDLGPAKLAVYSNRFYGLISFKTYFRCLEDFDIQIRKLQNIYNRKIRQNNKDCFEPDFQTENKNSKLVWKQGKSIKGKRLKDTKASFKIKKKIGDLYRKRTERLRCLQGELANFIRSLGDVVRVENDTIKEWQEDGSSNIRKWTQNFAPSRLVSLIKNRFELTDGQYFEIDTKNKLSQICPACYNVKKKDLSEREHNCECGLIAQRDLVSAFLAYSFDNEKNMLCEERVKSLFADTGNAALASYNITNGIIEIPSPTKVIV